MRGAQWLPVPGSAIVYRQYARVERNIAHDIGLDGLLYLNVLLYALTGKVQRKLGRWRETPRFVRDAGLGCVSTNTPDGQPAIVTREPNEWCLLPRPMQAADSYNGFLTAPTHQVKVVRGVADQPNERPGRKPHHNFDY